jgi:hypothetical protein
MGVNEGNDYYTSLSNLKVFEPIVHVAHSFPSRLSLTFMHHVA